MILISFLPFREQPELFSKDKKSWVGCGRHIPSVMDQVPVEEWCDCAPKVTFGGDEGEEGKEYPPGEGRGR